jgi:hypothetical protein
MLSLPLLFNLLNLLKPVRGSCSKFYLPTQPRPFNLLNLLKPVRGSCCSNFVCQHSPDPLSIYLRIWVGVFRVKIAVSEHLKRVTGIIFYRSKKFHSITLKVKSLKFNIRTASYSETLKTISAQTKITDLILYSLKTISIYLHH